MTTPPLVGALQISAYISASIMLICNIIFWYSVLNIIRHSGSEFNYLKLPRITVCSSRFHFLLCGTLCDENEMQITVTNFENSELLLGIQYRLPAEKWKEEKLKSKGLLEVFPLVYIVF
jgi:hypothetical protein